MAEWIKRKIPDNMNPWSCEINGVRYEYEAGSEQNVPEEVAHIIDAYWKSMEPVMGGSGGFDGPGGGAVKPFPVREVHDHTDIVYFEDLEIDTFYYSPPKLLHYMASSAQIRSESPNGRSCYLRGGEVYYFGRVKNGERFYRVLSGGNIEASAEEVDGSLLVQSVSETAKYLSTTAVNHFNPSREWNPTTKEYVDDAIAKAVGNIEIPEAPQADWNQNDPTAPDFVKNRTHWVEEGVGVTVLPTTDLIRNEDLGGFIILDPVELTSGNQYVVKFSDGTNSVEYTTMCTDMPENEDGVKWVLGDHGLLSGEPVTGEPFVMMVFDPVYVPDIGFGAAVLTMGAFTTISIDGVCEVVHKIDRKFLPGKVIYSWNSVDETLTDESGNDVTAKQAKKDMFNVVIEDMIDGGYRIPHTIDFGDEYVRFTVDSWGENVDIFVGTRPK